MKIARAGTPENSRTVLGERLQQLGLVAVVGAFAALLLWRILGYGYLPDDDALRHAAKAISGKSWAEILVLRPEITMDHNPGWHAILGGVHQLTGMDQRGLVLFSIVALFAFFMMAPLPWLEKPESWLVAVTGLMIVFPYFAERLLLGRPLLLTMGCTVVILKFWKEGKPSLLKIVATTALMALSAWVHGSWYLLVLIPIAFLCARALRAACILTGCWLVGSFMGATLTGHPWTFLKQGVLIPLLALGQSVPPEMLVREFEPFNGGWAAVLVMGGLLAFRKFLGRPGSGLWRDPVVWLTGIGWVLGFRVARFWLDWGLPALALWLAEELGQTALSAAMTRPAYRFAIAGTAGLVLMLAVGNDGEQRWSRYGKFECLSAAEPAKAQWLPEPGGILYSVDMSTFYHTFFCNPKGAWRYALGFEPTFMVAENRAVYEELCRTHNAVLACAPWFGRMTPKDRLIVYGNPAARPTMGGLDWQYAGTGTWVGRKRP